MQYYSTNGSTSKVSLQTAVVKGLAADRGLFMPERIPVLPKAFFNNIGEMSLQDISFIVANTLFGDDIENTTLKDIVYETLNFDIPLKHVSDNKYSLELFHGPTLAFKDVGARFMARLLGYFNRIDNQKGDMVNVLVATSGDTGSAVANGFLGVPGVRVLVLYPQGKVSRIQEAQFTTLGQNITAIEVDGTFDDCQALVKSAFMDEELNEHMKLTSANSINVARFLPQMFYYFYGYAQLAKRGQDLSNIVVSVPSGNFGNITAALIGKRMGLPIKRFIAANNKNDIFLQYLKTGIYSPKASVATIANAMDAKRAWIEAELEERVRYFKSEDKLIEAQRIAERTNFDIEMLKETGFCSGIENYSRHLAGRPEGAMPETLIDYFPDDFLIIIDESHISVPQIRGMYAGDRSRKTTLVEYGFRLPSALDNRPLNFEEFEGKIDQMLFVSATPGEYEANHELLRTEQIIRPTGLLDPEISVRPVEGQIDDLIGEVNKEVANHNKVLITTLTKRMAEDLTRYMSEVGIRVKYLHSDIDTLERQEIIRDLRLDVFDVLVGINLLREGLDIPEITLVAILDADKEGFLRSETSLIQTIGRAARNSDGHVIMYADKITDSMRVAIEETERRRELQKAYNEAHGITPQTIRKSVRELIAISKKVAADEMKYAKDPESMSKKELEKTIAEIQKKMQKAAAELNFEAAAEYRDKMISLKTMLRDIE